MRILCIYLAGAFAAMTVVAMGFGSGVASAADPLIGKKYSDAVSWISARRGTPVVTTVAGSQLALDDCVVTSWSKGGFLNSSGKNDRRGEYYLHLNCNNKVAVPGHPGNSVMTPEGAKGKQEREYAAYIAKNPESCQKDEARMKWCKRICASTGLCTV